VGKDHALIRRLRTLAFGLLTPFYFIRAGSLVSLPALAAAPAAFLILLGGKMLTKTAGVYPVTRALRSPRQEAIYTTLLMATGLTFGPFLRCSVYRMKSSPSLNTPRWWPRSSVAPWCRR
jgi:Kef-type K+ transport system membrane component KefB